MWAFETVFYQIYPLGATGAPYDNNGVLEHRILQIRDWIPHLKKLGIGAVYFSPVFESDTHGYNTRDYRRIDCRLGTNEDFRQVCDALHDAGIKVVLDGVFNHAGRGFFAFQDVLARREASPYKDWFHINFYGDDAYHDGLWYEGWEGNYDLVKLNLRNEDVVRYLLDSVHGWIDEFGIDGIRLDVAYMVDRDFLKRLRWETGSHKEDFFLLGEMLHGDYKQIMNDEMCHSVTNYECYKGLHSSFNSMNLFEIVHSLQRQFGAEPWTLYRGQHLLSFADNHDVTRAASVLREPAHLPLLYTMMFAMPGIPMIYYGSEWGIKGEKSWGDPALRPAVEHPEWNELTDHIAKLAHIWSENRVLQYGAFRSLYLRNRQCVIERALPETGERILAAVNADAEGCKAYFDAGAQGAQDLLSGEQADLRDGLWMPPYSAFMLRIS